MEAEHTCQIVPHDLNSVIRRIVRAMMLDDPTDVILQKNPGAYLGRMLHVSTQKAIRPECFSERFILFSDAIVLQQLKLKRCVAIWFVRNTEGEHDIYILLFETEVMSEI